MRIATPAAALRYCSTGGDEREAEHQKPELAASAEAVAEAGTLRSREDVLLSMTAADLVSHIREGKVTAKELVTAALNEIQARTVAFNLVTSLSGKAIAVAEALDAHQAETGKIVGPLHGVPILVNDDIHVAGMPTTLGTKALGSFVPGVTAPTVAALTDAGAVVIGKANMHELGLGLVGHNQTTGSMANPFNANYYAGGACGGAASAVANLCVPIALTTDTFGDSRLPGALCGIVAFTPSPGRYPRKRVWLMSSTRGQVSAMARTIEDLRIVDNILLASREENEATRAFKACAPTPPPELIPEKPVLQIPGDAFTVHLTDEVHKLWLLSLEVLKTQNVTVYSSFSHAQTGIPQQELRELRAPEREKTPPTLHETMADDLCEEDMELRRLGSMWNLVSQFDKWDGRQRLERVAKQAGTTAADIASQTAGDDLKYLRDAVTEVEGAKVCRDACGQIKDLLETYWRKVSEDVNALIIPTSVVKAPKPQASGRWSNLVEWKDVHAPADLILGRNCGIIAAAGLPSVTIPMPRGTVHRLPLGLLLVGRPGTDAQLLALAEVVDKRLRIASLGLEQVLGKSGKGEKGSIFKDEGVVLPDGPDWLEDRSKNQWAAMDDFMLAKYREGFKYTLRKTYGVRLNDDDEHMTPENYREAFDNTFRTKDAAQAEEVEPAVDEATVAEVQPEPSPAEVAAAEKQREQSVSVLERFAGSGAATPKDG